MRSRTRLGFSLTVASNVFVVIGWVIPFWFGRFYGDRSKTQWGLFYRIECVRGRCETIGGILSKSTVFPAGGDSRVELEAIAILATLGLALSLLSLLVVVFFHCSVRGKSYSYFNYVIGATILQCATALFVFLTIVTSGIAVGDFLSGRGMESVIEFPWSLMFYSCGLVLLIASIVTFTLIVVNWKQYRHIYARKRYYFNQQSIAPDIIETPLERGVVIERGARRNPLRHSAYQGTGHPYLSETSIRGVDNAAFTGGSLRYKYDPRREKYVGFLADVRSTKPYSSMPTRGSRYTDIDRDPDQHSFIDRYPTRRSWHFKLDDVLRESQRQRLEHFRLRDVHI